MALEGVRAGCLLGFAVLVAVWDVRKRRVPNVLALAGLAVGLGLAALGGWSALLGSLAGSGAFGGFLFAGWMAGLAAAGDAKAGFAFGALLGMPWALVGLLLGAAAGVVLAVLSVGGAVIRSGGMRVAMREGGLSGVAALVVTHPAWREGIPYAAALSVGSVTALVSSWGWVR